ncbi:MAG: hypothetical protein RIC35_01070 [Marinoscillum sp.]
MMKNKRIILLVLGNLIAFLIVVQEIKAQDSQGYIYGKVTTIDNKEYKGRIRWGSEEAFWHNYFNAAKTKESQHAQYGDKKDEEWDWTDFNWDFKSIWSDNVRVAHQFSCQFGDIKSIVNVKRSYVDLTLKNGVTMRLSGQGYNDVGSEVRVYDSEMGTLRIDWDRVDRVDFLPTPKTLNIRESEPLYGKVETLRKGTFVGYVQWDHDERVGDDKLDGDDRGHDVSFQFNQIRSITKERNGSVVVLKNGRDIYLDNSNDVNSENRGIIVDVPEMGRVDIPWKYFDRVTFEDAKTSGLAYSNYTTPKGLFGKVITVRNEEIKGKIIYDLDEEWEFETLDAKDDQVDYEVTMRHVKRIIPKNYAYSQVELRNGERLLLGEGRDVDSHNDGLLIFANRDAKGEYVKWSDIVEIIFD